MLTEELCRVALTLTPGVGNILIKQLISYCGSAMAVYQTRKSKLTRIPGIGVIQANKILKSKVVEQAEKILEESDKKGIYQYFYTDADYPSNLRSILDAPALIYGKGKIHVNQHRLVAIVGTRRATPYGREITGAIVKELKSFHPIIISGLAYGIDIEAHRSALLNGIPTIGVMASGLDHIYPAYHKKTVTEMIRYDGGILSEYPVGRKPDPKNFPARNRIIAGLADVVIVVEAAEKGGALITANIANSYNKEIFAIPGNVGSSFSSGCNQLIRDHKATIFTDIHDLARHMNWDMSEPGSTIQSTVEIPENCSEPELKVIQIIRDKNRGIHIDELSFLSQFHIHQVANLLLQLEFKGIIKSLPGKIYKLMT